MIMSYALARLLAALAESEAAALRVPMTIAIANSEGGLLFFGRMDGALPASTELAVSKAFTAACLRMATDEVGRLAQPGGSLYGIQHTHPGKIVLFGGGLPLHLRGSVCGAIGVSGGTVEQDIQVAQPVVEALEEMEYWSSLVKGLLPAGYLERERTRGLELRVREAFDHVRQPVSPRACFVLAGAIILAAFEDV